MNKTKKFYRRTFLNKKGSHELAALLAEVKFLKRDPYTNELLKEEIPFGTLVITDCTRSIRILLDIGTKQERRNSIYKLDQILKNIADLREFITELQ
jgi:hypothetical protein